MELEIVATYEPSTQNTQAYVVQAFLPMEGAWLAITPYARDLGYLQYEALAFMETHKVVTRIKKVPAKKLNRDIQSQVLINRKYFRSPDDILRDLQQEVSEHPKGEE